MLRGFIDRTTAQFFVCRNFETTDDDNGVLDGWWLEADLGPSKKVQNTFVQIEHCTATTRILILAQCSAVPWTGVECYDERWWRYAPVAGIVGAAYAAGLPCLFLYLARKFKVQADRGDKDVRRALEWIWAPYRDGKVWWIGAEMMRVLFLTSLVGILNSCESRVLGALLISVFFLVIFMQARPYRRHSLYVMQTTSLLVPLLSSTLASK